MANGRDAEAVAAPCSEDVVRVDPAAPKTLRGRAAVLGFVRDIMRAARSDAQIELIDGP